jgi:hypothetical protein
VSGEKSAFARKMAGDHNGKTGIGGRQNGPAVPASVNGDYGKVAWDPGKLEEAGFLALPAGETSRLSSIRRAWREPGKGSSLLPILAEIDQGSMEAGPKRGWNSPGLEAGLELLAALLASPEGAQDGGRPAADQGKPGLRLVELDRFQVLLPGTAPRWAYARPAVDGGPALTGDVLLYASSGEPAAVLTGCRFEPRDPDAEALAVEPVSDWFYRVSWEPAGRLDQRLPRPAPGFLSSPQAIASELTPDFLSLTSEPDLQAYAEFTTGLEALSASYARKALSGLGWDFNPDDRDDPEALARRLDVAPQHRRLFRRLLAVPQPAQAPSLEALRARFPAFTAELALLGRCGPRLREVLLGEIDPLGLLFPGGSLQDSRLFTRIRPSRRLTTGWPPRR